MTADDIIKIIDHIFGGVFVILFLLWFAGAFDK